MTVTTNVSPLSARAFPVFGEDVLHPQVFLRTLALGEDDPRASVVYQRWNKLDWIIVGVGAAVRTLRSILNAKLDEQQKVVMQQVLGSFYQALVEMHKTCGTVKESIVSGKVAPVDLPEPDMPPDFNPGGAGTLETVTNALDVARSVIANILGLLPPCKDPASPAYAIEQGLAALLRSYDDVVKYLEKFHVKPEPAPAS